MDLKLYEQDEEIISTLIKQGVVAQKQFDSLSENQLTQFKNLKHSLFDKVYILDNKKKQIIILDKNFRETGKIDIPGTEKYVFNTDEWQVWGNSVTSFDSENKKSGDFFWKLEDDIGIGFSKDKAYLYNPNFEDDQYLVQLRSYIYGAVPKGKTDYLPFDMYLSSDCSLLSVSDRGAGKIHLINVNENKLLKTFVIRNPGSNKCINVSISKKKNKIFVTDNMSSNLTIIDLQTMNTESKNLALGILGNICVSPDEENLYCIVTKPKQILKLIELNGYSAKKEFPLKGELFSQAGYIPYDLLVSSTDNKFVYIMTHISEPEPFTPVLTVIEADKEKAVQRFSIKDGSKPISIGFSETNPLLAHKKSLLELILDNKIVDENKIEEVKKFLKNQSEIAAIQETFGTGAAKMIEMQQSQSFTPPPAQTFAPAQDFVPPQQQSVGKEETEWEIKDVPKKVEYIAIPPSLDKIIYDKCREIILKNVLKKSADLEDVEKEKIKSDIEKTLSKKDSMPSIRLKDAIVKCNKELEWHDLSVIRLKGLLENYNFEAVFKRLQCLDWIRQEEMSELVNAGLRTIATNCPNCDAKLLGSYTCRQCGFELEKPEVALQRKLAQISTVNPFDNLKHGNRIIMDLPKNTFIELDAFRKVTWDLKKNASLSSNIEIKDPRESTRLKNNLTLVADQGTNRVFKLTEKGRIFWELDQNRSSEHKINQPISASASENGNVIIVDHSNHRIFEVNEENDIVWRYGQKGVEGIGDNLLRFPTSFQRTPAAIVVVTDSGNHRVIQMEERKITWQYGNENNSEGSDAPGNGPNQLNKPMSAWRNEKGNIFILDSGNNRVIEVNEEKKIIWEFKTNECEPESQIENPQKAYLLKTGKVLIIGETKLLEVDYDTKNISWSCELDKLGTQAVIETKQVNDAIKKSKITSGVSNPYARRSETEDPQEKEKQDKLRELIESKKTELGTRSPLLSNRSPVILSPGAKVSDLDFVMLDKNKSTVFMVNRKGVTSWTYGENNELLKPQFVYYNEPKSAFIADSDNKRVVEVDITSGDIVWTYSKSDEPDKLSYPRSVELTNQGTVLISDQLGGKVIEVSKSDNSVVWEYRGSDLLKVPYYASRLDNGNTLIVDWSSHLVSEITPDKKVAWFYGTSKKSGNEEGCLSYPEYASRLNNGNTLIVDTRNARIIEISPDKKVVWFYEGQIAQKLMSPTYARRMDNGNTLIVHSNNKQVIEVDASGKILWKYMVSSK